MLCTFHRFAHLIVGRTSALVAAMFFAVVLATQAQESVEEVALPPWSEPTLPSSEPAPSTQAAPLPPAPEPVTSAPEPLPPTATETLPSSSEPLPSSEQAFPSSPDPWSPSTNYTTAQTTVVPAPVATGPYGGSATTYSQPAKRLISGEPRRFHYGLSLTVRGVWDDNIFLSHTNKVSGYYFAIEPDDHHWMAATSRGAAEAICDWTTCRALFCSSITRIKTHLTSFFILRGDIALAG